MQYGAVLGTVKLGSVVEGMVVNSKCSGMGWEGYIPLDFATGSDCGVAATIVLTGIEEWHT